MADGELPEGWVSASLSQVAESRLGKMLDGSKNTAGWTNYRAPIGGGAILRQLSNLTRGTHFLPAPP